MSYIKREWTNGNVVGAVDLNRIEQGIEDSRGILVVNVVYDNNTEIYTLNKTWQEIYDAFPFVIEYHNEMGIEGKYIINGIETDNSNYAVYGYGEYNTDSANGYPSHGGGGSR